MFVDSVEITIASGHGGAGAVSFRREKFVIQGGPDGGNGGKGGDVYFVVDKNTTTLAHFRGHKKYIAKNGKPGSGSNCNGKNGENIYIKVPPGTQVIDTSDNTILLDLINDGEKVKILDGGKGGLGNAHFKSSINQRPTYAQKGLEGRKLEVRLELKLIADIALVGFPNVGKSSLISILTNSRPKIANYEFTTLIPNLGVVDIDEYHSYVMADIPGLIKGASEGRGLGLQFLQHIERTNLLLFMLDVSRAIELQSNAPQDSVALHDSILHTQLDSDSHNDRNISLSHNINSTDSASHTSNMQSHITLYTDIPNIFPNHSYSTSEMMLIRQFQILYTELLQYSPTLVNRHYAIALTKSDIILHEQLGSFVFDDKNCTFFDTKVFVSESLLQFIQHGITVHLHTKNKNENSKQPLFICPISSVQQTNIQALKYLLFQSLQAIK